MTVEPRSAETTLRYGHVPGIDKPIPRVIQGGTMLDAGELEAQSFALLDQVFEAGCNAFDTAHFYTGGNSERIIGRWLQARGVREQVVVITKCAHHNADRKRVTPFDITSDLYDSLARLRTDYIDLYLLHRDDPSQPVEPIVDVLNEHLRAGRIRALGCSNWTHPRIQAANAYAQANGLTPFVASSPQFSLADPIKEPWPDGVSISGAAGEVARAWYRQEQMALFAWSALAGGFFSGRFRPDNLDTFETVFDRACAEAYATPANFERLNRTRSLAAAKGATVTQIALAYVLNHPMNLFVVVGPSGAEKFKADVEAVKIQLTPEEMAWLDLRSDGL